jgi:hypothetical protein
MMPFASREDCDAGHRVAAEQGPKLTAIRREECQCSVGPAAVISACRRSRAAMSSCISGSREMRCSRASPSHTAFSREAHVPVLWMACELQRALALSEVPREIGFDRQFVPVSRSIGFSLRSRCHPKVNRSLPCGCAPPRPLFRTLEPPYQRRRQQ